MKKPRRVTEENVIDVISALWEHRERKVIEMAKREAIGEVLQTLEKQGILKREQVSQYYADRLRSESVVVPFSREERY